MLELIGCEETHGNPFRYCSCGWMEESKPDPDVYLKKAKKAVLKSFNRGIKADLSTDEVFIVWFVKVLGNWKALLSTHKWDGMYWEVTYNGAKNETYVDSYMKASNKVITDEELGA